MAKTSLDMDESLEGLLCYALGWVTGIVFLVVEKENKFVRFHAVQSIVTFLPLMVMAWLSSLIPLVGKLVSVLLWLLSMALWLILMIKAYQGEMYKLPIAGGIAERRSQ